MTKEGAALADAPAPELCAEYQADYEKAKFAAETAKNKRKAAATRMFQFYTNFSVFGCQVRVEEDSQRADASQSVQGSSRRVQGRPKGTFVGVIQ
jgi:hypothetical protein